MPVTLRFQSSGAIPGDGRPVVMRGGNLTIGRGQENDLVLPDPDRMISKNHCVVEDHNGNVVVIDLSTNGTFLNYGKVPLGRTPTPINSGDVLSMGGYELVVETNTAGVEELIPEPVAEGPVSHGDAARAPGVDDLLNDPSRGGDFLDDLLGAGPQGPSGVTSGQEDDDGLLPPLGEDDLLAPAPEPDHATGPTFEHHSASISDAAPGGSVIPDDWDDDLLAPAGGGIIPDDPFAEPEEAPAVPQQTPQAPPIAAVPVAPVVPPTGPISGDAARAFLHGAGAEDVQIPDAELPATMARVGEVFRSMVEGLREVLMTRTSIKSEFRINQTMISAHGNNPLKFSISPEQAVEALIKPKQKGYLDPQQAAGEALDDIKAHEVAMVTGMEAALKGVLERLDPKALEGQIETGGAFGSLLKGKKARYWEVYEKMYGEISEQAENDFQELFAKEFARAYQAQLERLKK